ncbi:hypothetical protein D3C77_621350 [compost metagenome]
MVIRRVFLRQPGLVGEGQQLATGLAHAQVELLRVRLRLPGQVAEAGPPAVHGLQEVEVADVGDPGLARCTNAGGEVACPFA